MTTTPLEPLLLPGQAAAPAGPCDMTGMYVMHHAFRRDLARFAGAAARTPVDDRDTWTAMSERWGRFAHELHTHHTKEDEAIWPLLLERVSAAGDAAAHEVLVAMEAEHGGIDPLLARVEEGLRALTAPRATAADRAGLVAAFTDLAVLLDQHLAHEEVDAIEVVQRYITTAEWAELEATKLRGKPTLRQMLFMLPWAIDELPEHARVRLLADAPPPVRLLVRIGQRGYRRLDARAFTHR